MVCLHIRVLLVGILASILLKRQNDAYRVVNVLVLLPRFSVIGPPAFRVAVCAIFVHMSLVERRLERQKDCLLLLDQGDDGKVSTKKW